MKSRKKNTRKYLKIIDQIQNIIKKNNVNWMNLLRLSFKLSPENTAKPFLPIKLDPLAKDGLIQTTQNQKI